MTGLRSDRLRETNKLLRLAGIGLLLLAGLSVTPPLFVADAKQAGLPTDTCLSAATLALDTPLTPALGSTATSTTWLALSVQQGQHYQLSADGASGLRMRLHTDCTSAAASVDVPSDGLAFTAQRESKLYLELQREGATLAAATPLQLRLTQPPPAQLSATALGIPPAFLRRASEFLEEWRGSPEAPEWATARLSQQVRLLYRPDVKGPAYYEFKVERLDPLKDGVVPAGFIELSAGEHDYPVSRWDFTGLTPTEEAQQQVPAGATILQYYKLDALSYVIEYAPLVIQDTLTAGTAIVNLGDIPGRIVGLADLPQTPFPLIDETIDATTSQKVDPKLLPNLTQEDWPSWDALKTGYSATYAPLLAALQQRAAPAWKLERDRILIGETLVKGDVRTTIGLPNATISTFVVTGTGAGNAFLQQEQLTTGGQPSGLRLTVIGEPVDRKTLLDVNLTIQYVGGFSETIKYNLANSRDLITNQIFLPLVSVSGGASTAAIGKTAASDEGHANLSDWGPWRYWWTDGDASSIRYGQFDYGSCKSGCGGTAWAMLFAWTDRRAAENHPLWRNHWGLYREGGGLGANVVAPLNQDAGVQAMTTEIRNAIGTFCIFGSGATWPWRMIDAANYVRPRASAAWSMQTRYDPTGLCWFGACDNSRNLARDQIIKRRAPAVVGTGWLKHYPLALGYAERSKRSCFLFFCSTSYSRWFYVNNGWYGSNNGWTSADVWFAGIYRP